MGNFMTFGKAAGTLAMGAAKVAAHTAKVGGETALSIIGIARSRVKSHPIKASAAAGAGTALALAGGAAIGAATVARRDFHFAGKTAHGRAQVYNVKDASGMPVRVLRVGGVYQSATYLDENTKYLLPFAYYRAFDVVFQEGVAHDRLLMLGGGGCAFPKHVLAEDSTTCIDVIEPDAAMTKIAREYFFLDDAISQFDSDGTRLHIIAEDGVGFLRRRAALVEAEGEAASEVANVAGAVVRTAKKFVPTRKANTEVPLRYDAIINDAFEGGVPCAALLADDVIADAKACLNEGGLYLVNIADPGKDDEDLRAAMASLSAHFAAVHVVPCADVQFGAKECCLIIATDGDYCFIGETQVQFGEAGAEGEPLAEADQPATEGDAAEEA